jgi:hypothetical protein
LGKKVSKAKETMGKMLVKKVTITSARAMTYLPARPRLILEIWPDLPVTVV